MKKQRMNALLVMGLAAAMLLGDGAQAAYQSSVTSFQGSSYVRTCQWIPGHWYAGYWFGGQQVCYGGEYQRNHCVLIKGRWVRGVWYPAHPFCWR